MKNEWPFGYSFQNFTFRCKKTKSHLGATVKFRVLCKKTNGRFGTTVKKRMAALVHAFCPHARVVLNFLAEIDC